MRKLAIACGAFSAGIFLAQYLLPAAWLPMLALALAVPGIGLILLRRRWLLPAIIALCALSAGLYCYGMHRMLTIDQAHRYDGCELVCSGRILSAPSAGDDWTRAEVSLRLDDRTELKTLLYDSSGRLKQTHPGDRIEGRVSLRAADLRNGERYDTYLARGIYLTANVKGKLTIAASQTFSITARLSEWNEKLVSVIHELFPDDTAPFFRALMLGEKSELYEDGALYLSMSRAGLMHVVAVSGMHVAFLVGMLRQLLGRTRRASLLSILLVWGFVLLTGAAPSAVRAGLMQTIALLAPVFGREDDPPTSLLFALALILLINPFAAGSVGLQLSFASLAGILLFSDRIRAAVLDALPGRLPWRLRSYLASGLANSLSVLVFSTPLVGLHFGYVPVLSPLSNILSLWAVPICFGFGYLCCMLSFLFLPAAKLTATCLSWLARYILWVARVIAAPGFSCLYLCLKANWLWLAFVYLAFLLAALILKRGWMRWLVPVCLAVMTLFAALTAARLYYGNAPGYMTAVDVGQGQSLVVMSGEQTLVIDCGNNNNLEDAGDLTGSYLCSRGREQVDLLVLTHLHVDHADGVLRLMDYLPVREILVGPLLEDPNGYLPQLREAAEKHGCLLRVLRGDERLRLGGFVLDLFAPGSSGDANERCLTAKVGVGGYDMLVTGDIDMAAERELLAKHDLRNTELLIVGHHGSKYASSTDLLRTIGADTAIISCGYNTFGHPTPETLERLEECGYTVYRTDMDGTVEIRVP